MRFSGSDMRLLQVFVAVVEHGGFAAAEGELNLSPSTISNHMSALEERLGMRLCQRGRRGFRLTEEGQSVYAAAARLDTALADFTSEVGEVQGRIGGDLKIGLVDAVSGDPNNRLHEVLARLRTRAPRLGISLSQERPQELQSRVRDGAFHCGIGAFLHQIDGLVHQPLYFEDHGLYCARAHPFFGQEDDRITADMLNGAPYVHRGYWREEDTRAHGFANVQATVYQIEPQFMLIRTGHYIGFLPHHFAEPWVAAGDLRAIAPARHRYRARFDLILPRGQRHTAALREFLRAVDEVWRGVDAEGMAEQGNRILPG
ncbi:LysR family transcriptional regulator [Paroceanicella profunda]|uniref:LysR family transcriptional regulator n=2 Tax=Paroceanicella profunda TaxID=2579971 RepID=A0A5B8G0U9_9RHOB|nr:LysR family transcriptional regulator [Paroceanicella profunda]